MKKNLLKLMVLMLAVFASTGQMWGQMFRPVGQPNAQTMQSQQVMQTGGAYNGTVYTPFSGTTPSQQSVPSASRSNGPRRVGEYPGWHQNENGEWVPDNVEEYEETGGGVEIYQSSQSPVGEPWVMALFAMMFAGVIAIRQYKRKTVETMNMKNSASKFIATLVLLYTLGVGQMWAATNWYKQNSDSHIFFNDRISNWAPNTASDHMIFLMGRDNNYGSQGAGSQAYDMKHLANTKLWYYHVPKWGDGDEAQYQFIAFRYASSAWTDWQSQHVTDRAKHDSNTKYSTTLNDNITGYTKYYAPTSSSAGASMDDVGSIATYTAYLRVRFDTDNTGYGAKITGGDAWGHGVTFDFTGTYLYQDASDNNDYKTGQSTIEGLEKNYWGTDTWGYGNIPVTGEVRFELKTIDSEYEIAGWGINNDDSPSYTTNPTDVTFNVLANTEYVAFIHLKQYVLQYGVYGSSHGTIQLNSEDAITSNASATLNHGTAISFTAVADDGYEVGGWYNNAACTGDALSTADTYDAGTLTAASTVYVKFIPKTCNISLDYQTGAAGYGDDGSITEDGSLTATYDAAMTALTGTMPTGTYGYKFQGFFSETGGNGTQYYDAEGSSVHTWDVDTKTTQTLYAFYEKDTISSLALSASAVHPWVSTGTKDSIIVTPTTLLTPDLGEVVICYTIEYSNGDEYDQSSTILSGARVMGGNSIKFRAPETSGSYHLKAELKTTNCSGTLLDTKYANFVVVSPNTITIRYLCENEVIKESSSASINALDSVSVEAPAIDGYTFSEWEYSAGITSATASNVNPKKFVASAPGTIKAKYVETPTVYFYNNLGWDKVYVTYDPYWDGSAKEAHDAGRDDGSDGIGAGNYGKTYHLMTKIPGTNIWKDEVPDYYIENGFEHWAWNIVFNNTELGYVGYPSTYKHFNTGEAVFRYDFDPQNTMFVPTKSDAGFPTHGTQYRSSTSTWYSSAGVQVHSNGYWKKYHKKNSGYSLRGTFAGIVDGESDWVGTNHNLVSTNEEDSVFSTTLKLNANSTYYFRIFRNNRNYEKGDKQSGFTSKDLTISYSSNRTNNEFWTNKDWVDGSDVTLNTATEGEYTFTVTFKNNGRMVVDVDYPDNVGDFQVMYQDTKHTEWHPTSVVLSEEGTKATTSFFVRKGKTPQMQWRTITGVADNGTITWSSPTTVSLSSYTGSGKILDASATGVDTTGVYNFIFDVSAGSLTLGDVQKYNGEYYIRTNSASSWKWQHYLESDHHMTYSEYADTHSGYSHYFMKYVTAGTNVKFVVANPYTPCVSDTLGQWTQTAFVDEWDNLIANANIRYSWNMHDNSLNRAYVGMVDRTHTPRQATKFIVLQGESDKLNDKDGNTLDETNQGTMYVGDNAIEFDDDENWIYEQTVMAKPGGRVKIYSYVNGNYQYLIGYAPLSGEGAWESSNSDVLIDGTGGTTPQKIRVIFDFKTNRLMAAWVPSAAISTAMNIKADIMILREHQEDANHIDLTGSGRVTLSTGKTVYGVMRFNKYILNNLEDGTSVPLAIGDQKTIYERANYYLSFPFKVSVRDIFGFGSYGPSWTLRYYDGKGRAKNGFWADSESFWKYVAPFDTLQANQGYLLTLNMNKFTTDQEVWNNDVENIELYFPAVGTIDIQQVASFDIDSLKVADYKSTINRGDGTDGDRRIKDSFWRCIGVPSFATITATYNDANEYALNWRTSGSDLPFLYHVNWNTNGLDVVNTTSFTFQPMHAYMVQNGNLIRWRNIVRPAAIVARQSEVESMTFELELNQNDKRQDHTYIRLTDNENITADFDFGQDLCKELNPGANIFTMIGYERAAANVMPLPMTDQTTIVPVGVKIAADGDYTFAMPEGTNGVGVTLVDNVTGTRTNLGLTDYSVTLTAGAHDERFSLEISPISQVHTDIEQTGAAQQDAVRKVMIDGVLYIVKDGQVFDARGNRIQ